MGRRRKDEVTEQGDPVWIRRPVENWRDMYEYARRAGIPKLMPPTNLHMTLATVRNAVVWGDLRLRTDRLVIPAGSLPIQIFAYTIKAIAFEHPEIAERNLELREMFPTMDHPVMRPHVSLYKGGRMPGIPYDREIVLGPEIASVFDASNARGIKHLTIDEGLALAD